MAPFAAAFCPVYNSSRTLQSHSVITADSVVNPFPPRPLKMMLGFRYSEILEEQKEKEKHTHPEACFIFFESNSFLEEIILKLNRLNLRR